MSRIHLLPEHLINQIAAGEVVERPVSVVKELLENSIDAGSRSVVIDLEAGGRRRVRVADDGEGLDRDDALLALERHATSKLRSDSELGLISTLGFRGEALPAIASVSRLSLHSSRGDRAGVLVEVEAGRVQRVSESGHPRGTTVDVRDLFFNTPARAKYLKAPATELSHITEFVAAYALAIPEVRLKLTHEGRTLIEAPPAASDAERIRHLFGDEWSEAIQIEMSRGGFRIRGLLAAEGTEVSARRLHRVYVNGRLVKDRITGHAVGMACEKTLPKGRQPAVFLFITCPPGLVDVNVHPAKAEVRFRNPGQVHDLVRDAVAQALETAMPFTRLPGPAMHQTMESTRAYATHAGGSGTVGGSSGAQANAELWLTSEPAPSVTGEQRSLIEEGPAALAHYRESYIVAGDGEGLLLIDQHAAHERVLYEQMLGGAATGSASPRQALVFPVTVSVPRGLEHRLEEVARTLDEAGITAEPFGEAMIVVRETPPFLEATRIEGLLADLLASVLEEEVGDETRLEHRRRKLVATIACHAAVKVRMPLTVEKMNFLIKELFRTASPLTCPHGRPAVLRFSDQEIEKGFKRR